MSFNIDFTFYTQEYKQHAKSAVNKWMYEPKNTSNTKTTYFIVTFYLFSMTFFPTTIHFTTKHISMACLNCLYMMHVKCRCICDSYNLIYCWQLTHKQLNVITPDVQNVYIVHLFTADMYWLSHGCPLTKKAVDIKYLL